MVLIIQSLQVMVVVVVAQEVLQLVTVAVAH
jgi:hypothetical protein